MPDWTSPLKKGNIVVCTHGLVVRILSELKPNKLDYSMDVEILENGSDRTYRVGSEQNFYQRGPDRFGGSVFLEIITDGKWQRQSLEEEFFLRRENV